MSYHVIRPTVNALIIKDNNILLMRRANTGWSDGLLCLPGGHVLPGESPRRAIQRELKEELGLTCPVSQLQICCVAARKDPGREQVAYEFVLMLSNGQLPVNNEPELCSEIIWVNPRLLPPDVISDFAIIITKGYLDKQSYLEIGY